MNLPLLQIRFLQVKRQLQSLGIYYGLLLLVLIPFLLYICYLKLQDPENAFYFSGFVVLMVWLVQLSRRDLHFVFNHLPYPVRNIFAEYAGFTLPFMLPLLFTPQWYLFPGLLVAFGCIVTFKSGLKKTAVLPQFFKAFPKDNFEWKSGLRSTYFLLLLLPVLALGFSWLKFVPLLLLWLFTTIITGFYQECESLQTLYAAGQNPKKVLHTKLKKHNQLLLFFLVPPVVVSTIFHPELWWVHALFLVLQMGLLSCAILLKYTTYSPNIKLRGNSVLLGIAAMGALIPVMLPLPLIFTFRNYGKATRNLNYYFHDQDN